MYAAIDCNNFYVSCERVFNPRLRGQPVVVLSNNDGCIISRSQEVKDLGIKMGTPRYQAQRLIEQHGIAVLSSNYALYGDMSNRVMETLHMFSPAVEVYSIDEAFLDCSYVREALPTLAVRLKQTVEQWTGIPVSIGIAPTKTLAKMANRWAKRAATGTWVVQTLVERENMLQKTSVQDVWGIGRGHTTTLHCAGVTTAGELAQREDRWIQQHMSVVGLRLVYELRGTPCLPLEMVAPAKKAIGASRSFVKSVGDWEVLREAVARHASRCAEKLRQQGSCAHFVRVMVKTNRFQHGSPQYANHQTITLPVPTNSTTELIRYAWAGLEMIYRQGYAYKKAGVAVSEIVPASACQQHLFDTADRARDQRVAELVDVINQRMGRATVRWAAVGTQHHGETTREQLSPKYTTSWKDIMRVCIGE